MPVDLFKSGPVDLFANEAKGPQAVDLFGDKPQGPVDLFGETEAGPVDLFAEKAQPEQPQSGPEQAMPVFPEGGESVDPAVEPGTIDEQLIKHPNAYGAYGAVKETAKSLSKFAWLKYLYPEEREAFMNLKGYGKDKKWYQPETKEQAQMRDLLIADLEFVSAGKWKDISKAVGVVGKKLTPTFHKILTKRIFETKKAIEVGKKTVGQQIAAYKNKNGVMPPSDTIKAWWSEKAQEIKAPISGADKVELMYNETTAAVADARKKSISEVGRDLKRKWVDVSGNIKPKLLKSGDAGKKAVMRHDLIGGSSSKTLQEVGELNNVIFKGLNKSESEYLNRLIDARRSVTIEAYKPGHKFTKGLKGEEFNEWINSLPEGVSKKLNARADSYFAAMRGQLDKLKNEGLLSDVEYKALLSKGDYSKRKVLDYIDPERSFVLGGRKISVPDSGIERLKSGTTGFLDNDAPTLLAEVVARTDARIARNRANKALIELAKTNPDNGVVSIAKVAGKSKAGKLKFQKAPNGQEKFTLMVDGKPQEVLMPKEFAEEWVMRNPDISQSMHSFVGWVTGTKPLKAMATGYNPEFAVSNLPRDIAHIWLTTEEYSAIAPLAALQIGRDMATVAKDALFKTGSWKNYINEGGGMEFLTHQGRVTNIKGSVGKIQSVLGYIGETSEAITRLALRQRAIRNGKTAEEATWIARNYLDFSQGGSYAKALDAGLPYLNAGIQGTRGIFRAAANNPANFTAKVAQIGTLAGGLYLANTNTNPEAWKQISDRDKVNNWIITTPFSYQDKDGNKKYFFFKIAKDQGQRFFASLAENLAAKANGEEIDAEQIAQGFQDALPLIPTQTLPPSIEAVVGYAANKDFWRMEDTWKGPEVSPQEEYTNYTEPAFVKFGEKTGMSPERTKKALEQFFTSGNVYTALAGYGYKKLFDEMDDETKRLVTEEIILKKPFVRRVIKSTYPYNEYGESIKEKRVESNTERYKQNREFDKLSQSYYDGDATKKDVFNFIKSAPRVDRDRLKNRHDSRGAVQNLPERRWWMNVKGLDPEARAEAYFEKWNNADDEKKKELSRTMRRLPGFSSKRFNRKFKELKWEERKNQ